MNNNNHFRAFKAFHVSASFGRLPRHLKPLFTTIEHHPHMSRPFCVRLPRRFLPLSTKRGHYPHPHPHVSHRLCPPTETLFLLVSTKKWNINPNLSRPACVTLPRRFAATFYQNETSPPNVSLRLCPLLRRVLPQHRPETFAHAWGHRGYVSRPLSSSSIINGLRIAPKC